VRQVEAQAQVPDTEGTGDSQGQVEAPRSNFAGTGWSAVEWEVLGEVGPVLALGRVVGRYLRGAFSVNIEY
jgi:hypothetical protein